MKKKAKENWIKDDKKNEKKIKTRKQEQREQNKKTQENTRKHKKNEKYKNKKNKKNKNNQGRYSVPDTEYRDYRKKAQWFRTGVPSFFSARFFQNRKVANAEQGAFGNTWSRAFRK